jgi:gliding motility-associated-like protein
LCLFNAMKFYALLLSLFIASVIAKAQCFPGAAFTVSDTCSNTPASFTATGGSGVPIIYNWDFNDPASGTSNTATGTNVFHKFSVPATYNVRLTIAGSCIDTVYKSVTIYPTPLSVDINDIVLCDVPYNLTAIGNGTNYLWSDGQTGPSPSVSISSGGRYWVKTSLNGCSASDTAKVGVWGQGNHGDYTWNFGNGGLKFLGPTNMSGSVLTTGTSSISDPLGNLLFYTDGQAMYDKNNVPMINGFGLLGTSSTQPALIVPDPRSNNLYYVFTSSPTSGLTYSVVDMSYNSGVGQVTQSNVFLNPAATAGILAGLSDSAGAFWTTSFNATTNQLVSYKINNSGLVTTPVSSPLGFVLTPPNEGSLKFSPDGKKAAVLVKDQNIVEVYDFDKATGMFSNPFQITNVTTPSGVEFAPDHSQIYVSTDGDHNLYQYDLSLGTPAAVVASQVLISNDPNFSYDDMQIGPDKRIYVALVGSSSGSIGIIDNPTLTGAESDFHTQPSTVIINSHLPNIIANYFTTSSWGILYADTCFGAPTRFQGSAPDSVRSWTWTFDGVSLAPSANPYVEHTFATPGLHTVSVYALYYCGDTTMTFQLTINPAPVLTLPNSITVCTGDSVQLDAGNNPGATYLWSNGKTGQQAYVNAGGSGVFNVYASIGACASSDTTTVTFLQLVQPELGNDTTLCFGQTLTLNPGNYPTAGSIVWSGAVNTTGPSIVASVAGQYNVDVNYPGCILKDSITVNTTPQLNAALGMNDTLCLGGSKVLSNFLNPYPGVNYMWSTGESGNSISVSNTNDYILEVSLGRCITSDTVYIEFISPPVVNLGLDSTLCSGTVTVLDAGNPGLSYTWYDGTTGMTKSVTSPSPNSNWFDDYWVDVKKGACVVRDSVAYTYVVRPSVFLGPDASLCGGNSYQLSTGNPSYAHVWSTGSTSSQISVSTSGTYWVDIFEGSCHNGDTVTLTFDPAPTGVSLPEEILFCKNKVPSVLISVLGASPAYTYAWQPGGETSDAITVMQEGIYSVVVSLGNCPGPALSTKVVSICEPQLYVASAFSPNGDNNNDIFQIYGESIEQYELRIFDRWGELIFVSHSLTDSWDGKYKGKLVEEGVYIWKVVYYGKTEKALSKYEKMGDVTVLK